MKPDDTSIIEGNNYLLFATFALLTFCFSVYYPALNWPDELYKLNVIPISENLYLSTLNWLFGQDCFISVTYNPNSTFGSNSFLVRLKSGSECYTKLKIINWVLVLAITVACSILLRKIQRIRLFLYSLIWPSSVFYVTGLNQQVVFHLVSIALVAYITSSEYKHLRIVFAICCSIALLYIDRSAIVVVSFLAMIAILNLRQQVSFLIFVLIVAATTYAIYFVNITIVTPDILYGGDLNELSSSLDRYRDSFAFSIVLFFVTFVYLGGTSAVFGYGLDYILSFLVLLSVFYRNFKDDNLQKYFFAFIYTFVLTLIFIPTIQSFRYYVFIVPILVLYLFSTFDFERRYFLYCILSCGIYLAQGFYLIDF
jgi:hypothetical protein